MMYGAILGDMIGAPYEFDRSPKVKDFPLFGPQSVFTDDSVMTIAVAEALLDTLGASDEAVQAALVQSLQKWGRRYPDAGYGGMFRQWLWAEQPAPYGSYGNGSAMRVAAAGWLGQTLEEARHLARLSASITHNHSEGLKGAEAVAAAIFLARQGEEKAAIRRFVSETFGYDLSRSCDAIRPTYHHVASCQETVPPAITAFLEGEDFEDVIRTAVSLGGDCDTLTCIAGSIAEAFYSVPDALIAACRARLPEDMLAVIDRFHKVVQPPMHNAFLDGNDRIEAAMDQYLADGSEDTLAALLACIRQRMQEDGHVLIPIEHIPGNDEGFLMRTLARDDGPIWMVLFTSDDAFHQGPPSDVISNFIDTTLQAGLDLKADGFVLNPWSQSFYLSREMVEKILTES